LNQKDITFSVKGAPQYLAPEVLGKKGHSHSVDWWALGIIIYEMLVGKPPFYEEDEQKMYKNIMSKKVTFPENA
jgi:serine/threonine protein kinase